MEILSFKHFSYSLLLVVLIVCMQNVFAAPFVTYLDPNGKNHAHFIPEVGKFGFTLEKMNVYCYKGREKELGQLLQSVTLNINIDSDDFNYFSGYSPIDVQEAHQNHKSIFSLFNIFSRSKKKNINIDPYNSTCIGIETADEYQVTLNLIRLDVFKLALLIGGLFTFFFAARLSRNSAFFYLSGISVGNVASIVILIWFLSKLFPKKPLMYGVLATGWSLAAYIAQIVVENIQPILIRYQKYVGAYILVMSFISFAFCYYKGPPTQDRSKNLIKWALQLVGLVAIFFSSEFREATVGIIIISLFLYYFPTGIFGGFRRFWKRRFPGRPKLLTQEEFEEQGRIETEKALKDLREFVKSPKCKDQWKLVVNLSHPTRFASFVEGDNHLTLDETKEYEDTLHTMELSDEDTTTDDDDENEESIAVDENLRPINKSRLGRLQNGYHHQSFNKSAQVTSSTPNGRYRTRQANNSASSRNTRNNNTFEMSDDE